MSDNEMTPTVQLVDFVENWWGESLKLLPSGVLHAPAYQVNSFVDDMHSRFPSPLPVPPLRAGYLRPEVRTTTVDMALRRDSPGFSIWRAPWLLLYAEEVVTENPIDTFLSRFSSDKDARRNPGGFLWAAIHMLAEVQALIGDGSLHCTTFPESNNSSPSATFTTCVPEETRLAIYEGSPVLQMEERSFLKSFRGKANSKDFQVALMMMCYDVMESLRYAQEGHITPLLHGRGEFAVLERLAEGRSRFIADGRIRRVQSLAELTLPISRAPIDQVIDLRRNEEVFADFRTALSSALTDVAGLEATENEWTNHARQSIQGSLAPARAKLDKAISRGGMLRDGLDRFQQLALSALGGGLGAILSHGNPVGSIAGISIGVTGQAAADYARQRPRRRAKRAATEIILSLGDPHSSAYS
jgi:hypothetical protein